jgi:hypothetical protein
MRVGSVVEWGESLGDPATVGDTTITPLARSLIVRWPSGGAVWSEPAAILVERGGRTDRIAIVNVNRRILWSLGMGTVALFAVRILRDRRRKD